MKDLFENMFGAVVVPLLLLVGLGLVFFVFNYIVGVDLTPVISIMVALTPVWLPVALFYVTYERWMEYVRTKFKINNGRTTLLIKLPQDVFKSPEAMESVFTQIHNVNSADNLWQSWIDGKHPLTYSFELVSYGGDVRFYINVPTRKTKNAVESQLYAQYPGIEITEEPIDYTAEITWDTKKYEMMSFHMGKKEEQIYPIKTYIDYGLDKMPKEEEKYDPMSVMIEQLGAAKPHERIWVQILATPHAKKNFKTGDISGANTWEKEIFKKIDEILDRDSSSKKGAAEFEEQPRLTMGERDRIAAMERNAGKYAYETTIRWMYITETGKFNGDYISPMLRSFAQYDIIGRNGISPRWRTDFDYNWFSDYSGKKKLRLKKEELAEYKARAYTQRDLKKGADKLKIFTAEELATIYHIPGRAIITPALSRIPSTRREAPPNLPIGNLPM